MANYYLLFSTSISDINKEEKDWIEKELKPLVNQDLDEDEITPNIKVWMNEHKIIDILDAACWPDFDWNFVGIDLCIKSEEHGSIENVVTFVECFLKKFRPKDTWYCQWAETCDKSHLDSFGGGAVVITANETRWLYTSEWISEQLKRLGRK